MAKEKEKPLTREDVLKMIEEHGGPEGLDLSWRNLEGIVLFSLDLHGIILESANLQEAKLWSANLQEANLSDANLRGADLMGTSLAKARLCDADLSRETTLENVDWGQHSILGDELQTKEKKDRAAKRGQLRRAESVYRNLKQWHTNAGMYDIAGLFYFREMTVRRKALEWWPNPLPRVWSKVLAVLCGYGEKPLNVVASAVVIIFGLAGIYAASALTFPSGLYYSAVSFTALGYGPWIKEELASSWVKGLGAVESFIGVFLIALFLITFVRKMTR